MKSLFPILSALLISSDSFTMERPQLPPLKPGVYITEIDNQTEEHIRVSTCEIEAKYKYENEGVDRFEDRQDKDRQPFMNVLKIICPKEKIIEMMPIAMLGPLKDKHGHMTSAAHLTVEPLNHPRSIKHFWVHRRNYYYEFDFWINSGGLFGGALGDFQSHKCLKQNQDSLFALIKVIIEKPDLRVIKMSCQIVPELPKPAIEEKPKAPRMIYIHRKNDKK